MKPRVRRHGILLLLLLLTVTVVPPLRAQETLPDPVLELMSLMSPEAKVGQLVLVTYPGTSIGDESDIARLIREYYIGGILLRPQNGNFGIGITPGDFVSITNALQTVAWEASTAASVPTVTESGLPQTTPYVPLLIGIKATEDGIPPSTLVSGSSALPTQMAIGATWEPAIAETVGAVLGRELAALGVNLYLGPDLDVLYTPRPGDPADLDTQVFGGDPFWVGEMGTAYIAGLHTGSEGRLLVAPRHLPGLGSADRPLEEEIPTIQKPLELLRQIELVPFFAAAAEAPGSAASADAFVVTHIRYRGFQGSNIRQTTRPISLDATALQLVTSLEEVAPWRGGGGVLIGDNLGMRSVLLSYDPRGLTFNARRVAQDALSAGNDLLILDHFGSPDQWDTHFTNIRDTLKFLASRYRDEPAFQVLVDASVYRILSMKLGIYPRLHVDDVRVDATQARASLGGGELVNAQVASGALTLVFPMTEDLAPSPPQEGDSVVVFVQEEALPITDAADAVLTPLTAQAVVDTILRFYGPDGAGVIPAYAVRAFSFKELATALEETGEETVISTGDDEAEPPTLVAAIDNALVDADWIVFATSGLDAHSEGAGALKEFLASQANLLDAHIAVLSFGPPYELDGTEISKLDVFYELYSTGEAFVEAGVRALFRDIVAAGDSPVDIPALNYYMSEQTMPAPDQVLTLGIVDDAGEALTQTARSNIHVGDVINLRTDMILDRNGRVVPDGTPVNFTLNYPQESVHHVIVAETSDGTAAAAVTLDRIGQLDITVQSEPATSSVKLELVIRDDGVTITEVEPTQTPTSTLEPTPTPSPTPTATATPDPVPTKGGQLPDPPQLPVPNRAKLIRWGFSGAAVITLLGFLLAREQALSAEAATRIALASLIGCLVGYNLLMAITSWWFPFIRYSLVAREYLGGVVTVTVGSCVMALSLWLAQPPGGPPRGRAETRNADKRYFGSRL